MRGVTRIQPTQYDTIAIYDGSRSYYFLLNRLGGDFRIYIPDKHPGKFHKYVTYRFKARHVFLDKLHDHVDYIFRLNEAVACEPFTFEGNIYREYIDICTEHPEGLVIADIISELICVEQNRSGEWIQDVRFDSGRGSYIHYTPAFSHGCEAQPGAWGSDTDLWIRIGDKIEVEPSLFYNPIIYPSTTGEDLYEYEIEASIYLTTDSDVLYEKTIRETHEIYEFDIDFPAIYDDSLKLVAAVTYKTFGRDYITLRHMIPMPPHAIQRVLAKKINIPPVNLFAPKILNIDVPKTPDYKLQTKHVVKPLFFRTHPSASILVHSGVNENIAINLDTYKSQVRYFTIKIGTHLFKEIGRSDKGVIFKILGNMLEPGEGTYHILNQDNDLVTSGPYIVK